MKKIVAVIVGLLILTGLVWYFAVRPTRAPRGASLLPDTTLLYVAIPDFSRSRDDIKRTELYALWQEPEVQALVEKPLRELFGPGNGTLHGRLLGLLQGEVFVALTHISPPPVVNAGFVIGADVRRKQLEAQTSLKWIERDLGSRFEGATAVDKNFLGKKYTVWQLTPTQQPCYAFFQSLLIVASDEIVMRDLILRAAGQTAGDSKPLAAHPRFQSLQKQMPAGHEFVAFVNTAEILDMFGPLLALAPQSGGLFQKLAGTAAAATSVTFDDRLIEEVTLVARAGNHTPAPPLERRTLALTSPDTSLYIARAANLSESYRSAMNLIAQSGQATLTASAAQFDAALAQRGVHLDEVLGHFGPELAWIGIWRETASAPEMALVVETRDARARPEFESAAEAGFGASEAQSYLGETLHTWHVNGRLSPTYVVTDKFLIFASSADYARELLAQSKTPGQTLADNAEFKRSLARLPAQVASLSYADVRNLFAALARANTAGETAFLDLSKLPKAETIRRHLSAYVSATVDTPELETTTTYSSLGKPLTILLGAAGVYGVAQPHLEQFIPAWPKTSSGSRVGETPRGQGGNPPAGNRMAPSRTPTP